ncbi:MAG: ComEA family DNA-binding protein [Gammaproteobacteria bacterium]|nr:ComEA family DNA-binding protein [Gammaproteobacteria bacterium]
MKTTQHTRRRGRRFHSSQRHPFRLRAGRRLLFALLPVAALLFTFGAHAQVNINTANADTLDAELSGVGPRLAAAIVSYREEYGPFETVDDLSRVSGIGPVIVEKNRALLQVEDGSQEPSEN